jgi:hypothetical protein
LDKTLCQKKDCTKEIGIGKVLGDSIARISGLLSKDFVKLVLTASVVVFPNSSLQPLNISPKFSGNCLHFKIPTARN